MMLVLLLVIGVLMIVLPPAGLFALGIFLYWLGSKMEEEQRKSEMKHEVRINEYNYEVLEEMK